MVNSTRAKLVNRLVLSISFYDVYTEQNKNTNNRKYFVGARNSDQQEFFVKRISQETKEQEFVKRCQGPHVVKLHEYIPPFLVLEHLAGGDLLSFVNEDNCETSEALVLVRDVLTALAAVHEGGVIHCDVKPENFVFVEADCAIDPTGVNIKLVDFGSARMKEDQETEYEE